MKRLTKPRAQTVRGMGGRGAGDKLITDLRFSSIQNQGPRTWSNDCDRPITPQRRLSLAVTRAAGIAHTFAGRDCFPIALGGRRRSS